jgi:sulfonate transport system substrate-binding protein
MRTPRPDHFKPTRPTGARRLLCLAAAVGSAAVLAACGGSSVAGQSSAPQSSAPESSGPSASGQSSTASASNAASTRPAARSTSGKGGITLRVGDQAGTGAQALLEASGLLSRLPFKIEWADFTSGPPMLQAMGAGSLDVGGVGDAPPVFAAAGGADIRLVGALSNNPNSAALLVPHDSKITSIGELRGKKIAVAQGSSADYHLLTVLNKAGLSVHDVTLEYLQPAEALAALSSGSVDAWDTWSPFVEEAVAQDHDTILVNGNGYGANYSYVVAARSAIADARKAKEIRAYLKVLDQAHAWANKHTGAWAAVWARATGLPDRVMQLAANDDTQRPIPVDGTNAASEQSLVDAFSKAGLIPSRYDFSKYIDPTFNDVLPAGP